jgi:transcription initiation factor TFIIIB Brf1 subunit/transcription initiation factor TFIIB
MNCDCANLSEQNLLWSSDQCVCTTCARVVEAHPMEQGPEWFDDAQARCPTLGRYDAYLPDLPGVVFEGKKKRARDPHKTLKTGLRLVDTCSLQLGLTPDHKMTASAREIFTDFVHGRKKTKKTIRQRDLKVYAAVAMYFGCKIHEQSCDRHPRTIREIAASCEVTSKCCTDAIKEFKTVLSDACYAMLLFRTVTAEDLFVRALASLSLPPKQKCAVQKMCTELYAKFNDILAGKTPETVCCVCLFVACERSGVDVDKTDVHKACAVSSATLKNALQFLKIHLRRPPLKEMNI